MNSYGYKYLANGFGEYIYVHDYQNVLDFDYYFNIFQPECVIFEVAEYTFSNGYFDYGKMLSLDFNAPLESSLTDCALRRDTLRSDTIAVEPGETLTKIIWQTEESFDAVWVVLGENMDMRACAQGYEITVTTDVYETVGQEMVLYAQSGNVIVRYEMN